MPQIRTKDHHKIVDEVLCLAIQCPNWGNLLYSKQKPNPLIKIMTASLTKIIKIEDFLRLSYVEESPAWEYIDGEAIQKPMPKIRHSILQKRLLTEVDRHSESYTALPELRCTFAGRSVVPDIAIIAWDRLRVNELGEPEDNFIEAPDWSIEILSPEQKANRVIDNLLHCIKHGSRLGWMLDPDDYSVLIFVPHEEPHVCRGACQLQVLEGVHLALTAEQVFAWLKTDKR
jgi:Uma2 family endonuclease